MDWIGFSAIQQSSFNHFAGDWCGGIVWWRQAGKTFFLGKGLISGQADRLRLLQRVTRGQRFPNPISRLAFTLGVAVSDQHAACFVMMISIKMDTDQDVMFRVV